MNVRQLPGALLVVPVLLQFSSSLAAQQTVGFKPMATHELAVPAFTDSQVGALMGTLDALLSAEPRQTAWTEDSDLTLWNFMERVQAGQLTPDQEARVSDHFTALEHARPAAATALERQRYVLTSLTVGKTAPDIVGTDLNGTEFSLSDYRGKVVVLTFSGDWCGACRAEYPYQRLLLDLYRDRPLALLSVNSDATPEQAKASKTQQGLPYRSWWDGGSGSRNTRGSIATAWGVGGWPTVYVIDENGVIRFVNLRQEDLLRGVRQLMTELAIKTLHAQQRRDK